MALYDTTMENKNIEKELGGARIKSTLSNVSK